MNETCPIHEVTQTRIDKLETKVDKLQTDHAQTFTRIDNLCEEIRKLTVCINEQVKQWASTHDDFIITRAENKRDHENFIDRIDKTETFIRNNFRSNINDKPPEQVVVNVNETHKKEKGFFEDTLQKVWDSWITKGAAILLGWALIKWGAFGEKPISLLKFFGLGG